MQLGRRLPIERGSVAKRVLHAPLIVLLNRIAVAYAHHESMNLSELLRMDLRDTSSEHCEGWSGVVA